MATIRFGSELRLGDRPEVVGLGATAPEVEGGRVEGLERGAVADGDHGDPERLVVGCRLKLFSSNRTTYIALVRAE